MSTDDQSTDKWINPLLEKLDLVHAKRVPLDLRLLWAELEAYRVPERIHAVAANINQQAGHHILNLLDYLPPQRYVIRVVYRKNRVEYVLVVGLRSIGSAATFHCEKATAPVWARYIPGRSKSREHAGQMVCGFRSADLTDKIIQNWFSFLLSGFSKEFEGGLCPPNPLSGELPLHLLSRRHSA